MILAFSTNDMSSKQTTSSPEMSRRSIFATIPFAVIASQSSNSNALDMDAFMQKELSSSSSSSNKKMSDDEALCRFGQPSQATGEACLRAGMSTKRPTGVDAFGKVDRGDYMRCKAVWVDPGPNEKLTKEWRCQDGNNNKFSF